MPIRIPRFITALAATPLTIEQGWKNIAIIPNGTVVIDNGTDTITISSPLVLGGSGDNWFNNIWGDIILTASANSVVIVDGDVAMLSGGSGGSSGGGLGTPTVILVAPNGNDSTGARGTLNPYLTIAAAQAVAQAGDLIYVRKGTYTVTAGLANNIGYNYELQDGVVINANTAGLNLLGSDTTTVNYKIYGSGSVNKAIINQQSSTGRMMHLLQAATSGSNISMEGMILNDSRSGGIQVGAILDWSGGNNIFCNLLHVNSLVSTGYALRVDDGANSNIVVQDCYLTGNLRGIQINANTNNIKLIRCIVQNASASVDYCAVIDTCNSLYIEDSRFCTNNGVKIINMNNSMVVNWVGTNILYGLNATNSIANANASDLPVNISGTMLTNKPVDTSIGTISYPIVSLIVNSNVIYSPSTLS